MADVGESVAAVVDAAEQAVREYLELIEDPSSLIDHDLVAQLDDEIQNTTNVLDQIRLRARRTRAATPDAEAVRRRFIQRAGFWATREDVVPEAFLDMGVSRDTLIEAGVIPKRTQHTTQRTRRSPVYQRINSESLQRLIVNHLRSTGTPAIVKTISEQLQAPLSSVRREVDVLVAAGQLVPARMPAVPGLRGRQAAAYTTAAS